MNIDTIWSGFYNLSSRYKLLIVSAIIVIPLVAKTNSSKVILESKEFEITKEFIFKDNGIQNKIGGVERFGFFASGYRNDKDRNSSLILRVIGEKDSAKIKVTLSKEGYGFWKVKEVKFLKWYSFPWLI